MAKIDLDNIVVSNISLTFTEMRGIIQALAHSHHAQTNITDETRDHIIKYLKLMIAGEVINMDLNSTE